IADRIISPGEGRRDGGSPQRRGEGRCPRAALHPLPGGPGIKPSGITTGVRGASLEPGRPPADTSAASVVFPRSLARIAPGDYTPLGQSRGGTPEGEPSPLGRRRTPLGAEDDPALSGVPLPSFIIGETGRRRDKAEDTHPRGSFPPPVSRFTRPRSEAPGRKPRRRTERFVRYSPSPGWEGSRAFWRAGWGASLRGAERRSNPGRLVPNSGLLRSARNDKSPPLRGR